MPTIPITSIIIAPNRQRRLFDPIAAAQLMKSIQDHGLLHPIILRRVEDPEGYVLVAGERRLRAITDMHELDCGFSHNGDVVTAGRIPYTLLSSLSPLAAEEAELEENIQRTDLTWQERAAATARLQALRLAQSADATLAAPPPTKASLAAEVFPALTSIAGEANIRRDLILAKHLNNPAIAGAATPQLAYKELKRQADLGQSIAHAEKVGKLYSTRQHTLVNADACEWLEKCPDGLFNVILTDPPYGMGADTFGDAGRPEAEREHTYADDHATFIRCLDAAEKHFDRITTDAAHLYWFCDFENFALCRDVFTQSGWRVFHTPFIWFKPSAYRAPWPDAGPQRKYETILYAQKGGLRTLKMAGDVLTYPPDVQLNHPAQKPVALYADLLSRSALPGDAVLDPFCGTGTILAAAHQLKLRATAVERDLTSYGIASRRLAGLEGA